MTLSDAIAEFEHGRTVVDGTPYRESQTGEPYVEIISGRQRKEGYPILDFYPTKEDAITAWLASANDYASIRHGTLYWRERPIADICTGNGWIVGSRMLISDRPVVESA